MTATSTYLNIPVRTEAQIRAARLAEAKAKFRELYAVRESELSPEQQIEHVLAVARVERELGKASYELSLAIAAEENELEAVSNGTGLRI